MFLLSTALLSQYREAANTNENKSEPYDVSTTLHYRLQVRRLWGEGLRRSRRRRRRERERELERERDRETETDRHQERHRERE